MRLPDTRRVSYLSSFDITPPEKAEFPADRFGFGADVMRLRGAFQRRVLLEEGKFICRHTSSLTPLQGEGIVNRKSLGLAATD